MTCKKLTLIACTLCLAIFGQAQQVEFKKSTNKTFKISPETSVQIINKYGNIHIVKSETDSVTFSVEIKATDKDSAKATKIINNISIQFDASMYYVIAKTAFNDYKGSAWSNLSDIASTVISGGNKVQINWTVAIPENTELKIENKFGNIYMLNQNSGLNIDLSNGDFQAQNLTGKSILNVEFGNVKIKNITSAKLELSYSETDITNAGNIDLYSRSTTLNIASVNNLEINSRHDKLYIDSITVLKGEANFSVIKINKAVKSVLLNLKFGSIYFNLINSMSSSLFISSFYTDIYLNYDNTFSGKFESNYKKTTLVLPSSFDAFAKVVIDEKTQEYKLTGLIGEQKTTASEIKLNLSYGSLSCVIK